MTGGADARERWSDWDILEILYATRVQRCSAATVAVMLGETRHAVLGVMRRMKHARPASPEVAARVVVRAVIRRMQDGEPCSAIAADLGMGRRVLLVVLHEKCVAKGLVPALFRGGAGMTVRIVSNGSTSAGIQITTDDGVPITGVLRCVVSINPDQIVRATFTVAVGQIDVFAHPLLCIDTIEKSAESYGFRLVSLDDA